MTGVVDGALLFDFLLLPFLLFDPFTLDSAMPPFPLGSFAIFDFGCFGYPLPHLKIDCPAVFFELLLVSATGMPATELVGVPVGGIVCVAVFGATVGPLVVPPFDVLDFFKDVNQS